MVGRNRSLAGELHGASDDVDENDAGPDGEDELGDDREHHPERRGTQEERERERDEGNCDDQSDEFDDGDRLCEDPGSVYSPGFTVDERRGRHHAHTIDDHRT